MICLYDLKHSLRTNINGTLATADVNKVQKLAVIINFLKKILTKTQTSPNVSNSPGIC